MRTTRRDLIRIGALAAAAATLPGFAANPAPVARAAKPLRILILGGTGFTGPFQVAYALARGHQVTLFNRGKRPSPEWPGEVEQLHGDRNTGDLSSLKGRSWDVCIDNPTSLPFWVRDAGQVLAGNVGSFRPSRSTPTAAGRALPRMRRWPPTRAPMRWPRPSRR